MNLAATSQPRYRHIAGLPQIVSPQASKSTGVIQGAATGAFIGGILGLAIGFISKAPGAGSTIGTLAGAGLGGALGYYEAKGLGNATIPTVTLVAGAMPAQTLSLSGINQLNVLAPVGGNITSASTNAPSTAESILGQAGTNSYIGSKTGSTVLTIAWTDNKNVQQTTTIPVTVIS